MDGRDGGRGDSTRYDRCLSTGALSTLFRPGALLKLDVDSDAILGVVLSLSHRLAEDGSSGGALGVLVISGRSGSWRIFLIWCRGSEVVRFDTLR